jgi:hypothetical protein
MKDLAIIVSYRDREEHLKQFIPYMKNYLSRKGFSFDFFVIEQEDGKPFNRGKLLNIGYKLANEKGEYQSIVLHDVDMLPVNADYSKSEIPTHLASEAEQFGWKLPMGGTYEKYFGGITLFPFNVFGEINGYSNEYWGWGAEDDDLLHRVKSSGFEWTRRYPGAVRSLNHEREINQEHYRKNIAKVQEMWQNKLEYKNEGLNSLEYEILEDKSNEDYAMIKVRI